MGKSDDSPYREVHLLRPYNGVMAGNSLTVTLHEYNTLIENGTAIPVGKVGKSIQRPPQRKDVQGPDVRKDG